jgi:hypothetical protein
MTKQQPASQVHARPAAWGVLAITGGTTLTFNVWHSTHAGLLLALALLYGFAPVLAAMGLSHIVSAHQGGRFMKAAAFAVMAGAMALSMGATAAVLRPAAGPVFCWLFGIVIDSAALVALQVILSPESRAAARAARGMANEPATPPATATAPVTPPETPAEPPATAPEPGQGGRQGKRQPSATDRAKANAKARQLMIASPAMSLADVAARSGVSERTASRIKGTLPRQLHVAEG